ncbi:hypothetical protein [Selenomonas ruminantium]|uniref:hypothetical protein n=1 Tax=Selenomonas ruminantium TaxID=971 RepID=UPI0026E9FF37|nr:hypothetical protein [Selenomonas ruminantium]
MKIAKLDEMKRGWFIGDFTPTLKCTQTVEVAVKNYRAGDYEAAHYHRIATEYTVIIEGRVLMFGCEFHEGDIVVVEPGDETDFLALTDTKNVVVKLPGVKDDKYLTKDDKAVGIRKRTMALGNKILMK